MLIYKNNAYFEDRSAWDLSWMPGTILVSVGNHGIFLWADKQYMKVINVRKILHVSALRQTLLL